MPDQERPEASDRDEPENYPFVDSHPHVLRRYSHAEVIRGVRTTIFYMLILGEKLPRIVFGEEDMDPATTGKTILYQDCKAVKDLFRRFERKQKETDGWEEDFIRDAVAVRMVHISRTKARPATASSPAVEAKNKEASRYHEYLAVTLNEALAVLRTNRRDADNTYITEIRDLICRGHEAFRDSLKKDPIKDWEAACSSPIRKRKKGETYPPEESFVHAQRRLNFQPRVVPSPAPIPFPEPASIPIPKIAQPVANETEPVVGVQPPEPIGDVFDETDPRVKILRKIGLTPASPTEEITRRMNNLTVVDRAMKAMERSDVPIPVAVSNNPHYPPRVVTPFRPKSS